MMFTFCTRLLFYLHLRFLLKLLSSSLFALFIPLIYCLSVCPRLSFLSLSFVPFYCCIHLILIALSPHPPHKSFSLSPSGIPQLHNGGERRGGSCVLRRARRPHPPRPSGGPSLHGDLRREWGLEARATGALPVWLLGRSRHRLVQRDELRALSVWWVGHVAAVVVVVYSQFVVHSFSSFILLSLLKNSTIINYYGYYIIITITYFLFIIRH